MSSEVVGAIALGWMACAAFTYACVVASRWAHARRSLDAAELADALQLRTILRFRAREAKVSRRAAEE